MIAVLDNIRSIHNVGSMFRTADAAGMEKLMLCGITPAPLDRFGLPNEQLAKVALGAEQTVAWEQTDETIETIAQLQRDGYIAVAVEQDERAVSLFESKQVKLSFEKTALVFGNEVDGLDKAVLDMVDHIFEIPQFGSKESLNVSVSFGIATYTLRYLTHNL